MAIVLGWGDSFHLLPRVISHLSPGGFPAHVFALSWGKFVTSMTMTIFYVLFNYFYRSQSQDRCNTKRNLIYLLAIVRMVLTDLPQNNWGTAQESYLFGIYRNIPFAIMGALLIYWTYKAKDKPSLKHMALCIFLSFAFYIPVVLWADAIPALGALMMPKTVAYLMIVVLGYKYFIPAVSAKNLLGFSYMFVVMGLFVGVFYREFTKFYGFTAETHLGKLHVHTLVLGFVLTLILYLLTKGYDADRIASLKKPIYIYIGVLTFSIVMMAIIGIYEVVSEGQKLVSNGALAGMSGLGHIALSIGLVWTIIKIFQYESAK